MDDASSDRFAEPARRIRLRPTRRRTPWLVVVARATRATLLLAPLVAWAVLWDLGLRDGLACAVLIVALRLRLG